MKRNIFFPFVENGVLSHFYISVAFVYSLLKRIQKKGLLHKNSSFMVLEKIPEFFVYGTGISPLINIIQAELKNHLN